MRVKDWQKVEFIKRALAEDIGRGDFLLGSLKRK